jgi:hypothetical protein
MGERGGAAEEGGELEGGGLMGKGEGEQGGRGEGLVMTAMALEFGRGIAFTGTESGC